MWRKISFSKRGNYLSFTPFRGTTKEHFLIYHGTHRLTLTLRQCGRSSSLVSLWIMKQLFSDVHWRMTQTAIISTINIFKYNGGIVSNFYQDTNMFLCHQSKISFSFSFSSFMYFVPSYIYEERINILLGHSIGYLFHSVNYIDVFLSQWMSVKQMYFENSVKKIFRVF